MQKKLELKPLFKERMKKLLGEEYQDYIQSLNKTPLKSIRCNTLKISAEELKKRLEEKNWKIKQPFKSNPEIFLIESKLQPGELGRTLEHQLGYYYIQELSSMLPIIALNPKENENFLDLCSSPGSKTTQAAAKMQNTGIIIANEVSLGRIKILSSNLERCGVTNVLITKKDGRSLCTELEKQNIEFDKILIDAPCSGEGTIRTKEKTARMWNIKTIKSLSRLQKKLLTNALKILKAQGEIIYSTCTHAPEENEEVIDFILKNNSNVKIQNLNIPRELNPSQGITKWQDKEYLQDLKYACRIYPHKTNSEGFFIAKLKKAS